MMRYAVQFFYHHNSALDYKNNTILNMSNTVFKHDTKKRSATDPGKTQPEFQRSTAASIAEHLPERIETTICD